MREDDPQAMETILFGSVEDEELAPFDRLCYSDARAR